MYKIINLDMDGVLADFDGRVKQITGKTFSEFDNSKDAWEQLGKYKEIIYKKLNVLEGAFELVNEVFYFAEKHNYLVSILTALPKGNIIPMAEEHKRQWLKKHFGHFPILQKRFKIGAFSDDKWKHCYSTDDILIDDYYKNIDQWNAVGGKGILHTNLESTINQLNNLRINSGYNN